MHSPCLVSLAAVHAFCAFCAGCSPQHCKSRLPCHNLKTLVLSDRHTGAAANATYGNFTGDRIFHSPTDLNWIIARVLVFNDSDTAAGLTYSGNISHTPYSTASMPAHSLCSMSVSSGHACVHCCVPFKYFMPAMLQLCQSCSQSLALCCWMMPISSIAPAAAAAAPVSDITTCAYSVSRLNTCIH